LRADRRKKKNKEWKIVNKEREKTQGDLRAVRIGLIKDANGFK
jgi:hypothetical protein